MSKKSTEKDTPDQKLTAMEVDEVIEVCIASPMEGYPGDEDCLWGLPVLSEGEPGVAKTARVKQLAKVVQLKARSLFAAQHAPEDFSGALIPDGKGGANQISPLAQIRELIKEKRGIIFLDEINGAPPATQGALQSFVHERVAGDEILPGKIRIICAQNPEEIATGGNRMAPALANRFVHITDPGPTASDWSSWLMGKSSKRLQASMESIEKAIISDWPNLYPETQALFAGFMSVHGSALLHKRPDIGDPRSAKNWPSHRTWDYATRGWTAAVILEKSDAIRAAILEACVGPGAAVVFHEYRAKADIPKPLDVLHNRWKMDTNRLDIILAAYTGAMAYVKQRPDRKAKMELAALAWGSLEKLIQAKLIDVAIPSMEMLIDERLGHNANDDELKKAANKVLIPIHKSGIYKYYEEKADK